ncbi:MAG: hypothetical protein NTY01_08205 [Verrucomicrobia bacterium]|nr:hypothetical protein [Verrucomicrobiota bacterium]
MAIVFEANYSKKLGLPGYSSHQYSVTVRCEVADIKQVPAESNRIYKLLQDSVDKEIQNTGFLPGNGNGNGRGHDKPAPNGGNGDDTWACSDKQKALIIKIVEENKLDKQEIESLALERFGQGVKELNRLEASGLIEELLEKHGTKENGRTQRRYPARRFQPGSAK